MFTFSNKSYCAAVQQELREALALHYDRSVPGARLPDTLIEGDWAVKIDLLHGK